MLKLNTKVLVVGNESCKVPGVIKGLGWTANEDNSVKQHYIVALDKGFYDPNGGYVSHIVAHFDNVVEK